MHTEYLIQFAHRHRSFQIAELEAVLSLRRLSLHSCSVSQEQLRTWECDDEKTQTPFLTLQLPSEEDAIHIFRRCILVKGIYLIWGSGSNYDEAVKSVESFPAERKNKYFDDTISWCINVAAFGSSYSMKEQESRRRHFTDILPFPGPIKIKNADLRLWVLEDIGYSPELRAAGSPRKVYFVQEIGGSGRHRQGLAGRDMLDKIELKKRKFLGPTAMDHELALVMANQARITGESLVLEPFVGSGSILVACSMFKAKCVGFDIDMRVLLGDTEGNNIFTNFSQYQMQPPEIQRADISNPPFLKKPIFDAIICDPPYGIRAGARKMGPSLAAAPSKRNKQSEVASREEAVSSGKAATTNIPRVPYEADDVMKDLLKLASNLLVKNGRLVYLLPVNREDYSEERSVPRHPNLKLISNSEQVMTTKLARRMITMERM